MVDDGPTDDGRLDGRTPEHGYTISSPCEPDGSGELKKRMALTENRLFACAKTKTQISFTVTAKLISAFVFATQIVQSLFFLNLKFQASSLLL